MTALDSSTLLTYLSHGGRMIPRIRLLGGWKRSSKNSRWFSKTEATAAAMGLSTYTGMTGRRPLPTRASRW